MSQNTSNRLSADVVPTTHLEAVNVILSGLGETPVNSLEEDLLTSDVTLAVAVLNEVSKEVQGEGWQWNTQDNYPLKPNQFNLEIEVHPSIIRIHFNQATDRELILRGTRLFDRQNHTFKFPADTTILCTITELLPFTQLPEAARRYITLRALRMVQERTVGSGVLSQFHERDEARARSLLLAEERRQDRPNMLTGVHAPTRTWQPLQVIRR